MKKYLFLLIVLLFSLLSIGCNKEGEILEFYTSPKITKAINKVDSFPDIPNNYSYFDYSKMAKEVDKVVFSFAENNETNTLYYDRDNSNTWSQIGYFIDQPRQPSDYNPLINGYLKRSFALPTYLGDSRFFVSGSEPITYISMVLGSSFAGINKQNQIINDNLYDFVEMTMAAYNTGSNLVQNVGTQGQSFWYDIFPQIVFTRLFYMYQDIPYMKEMVLDGANEWLEALPFFVKNGEVDYEFVGYNVQTESPTFDAGHIEPPNGGLAFLFYAAYEITKEEKYLDGCKEVLDYFQTYSKNPNYEAMTDYAPYVAAILNYKYNTNYDVGKFLDFIFEEDSAFRGGWSVMNGSFGSYAVDGLVGQSRDYAFAMNSFHLATTLVPLVKYDTRYADYIGKYILNLVNNAKVFFPTNISLSHQTMKSYLSFDKLGSICYEGFRNNYNGVNGLAMGDATTMFNQPSDLSIYSSAWIGALGGIVNETNQKGILEIDLNNTDSFGNNKYLYHMYYNPYETEKEIKIVRNGKYDLFDTTTMKIIARNVTGESRIVVPAKSSSVIVTLPAKSNICKVQDKIMVGDDVIAKYNVAVNIRNLSSRQNLTEDSVINIDHFIQNGDSVVNMKIYFDDILAYDGDAINEFRYNKSILSDTDYTLKVVITTKTNMTDYATKFVVCR